MDPATVLFRGRKHTAEGRHAEALEDFIWFHKHALEHNPAYYGVRLSFALGFWKELAGVYPPAATAMDTIKSEAVAALLRGEGSSDLFHDVVAINDAFGGSRETYELFVALKSKHPEQVRTYADLAMPSILEAEDYKLAMSVLPHPEQYLLAESERLNDNLERGKSEPGWTVDIRLAVVHHYCENVRMLLRVLEGVGEKEWARAALDWAIALVASRHARYTVATELTSARP